MHYNSFWHIQNQNNYYSNIQDQDALSSYLVTKWGTDLQK